MDALCIKVTEYGGKAFLLAVLEGCSVVVDEGCSRGAAIRRVKKNKVPAPAVVSAAE